MAIRNVTMRNTLANAYRAAAAYGALFTADPGTGGSATGEVSGGAPAYARIATGFAAASASVTTSAAMAFNVPSGATVTYFGVATSATATTADVQDSAAVTSQTFSSQGSYTVNANYTQT